MLPASWQRWKYIGSRKANSALLGVKLDLIDYDIGFVKVVMLKGDEKAEIGRGARGVKKTQPCLQIEQELPLDVCAWIVFRFLRASMHDLVFRFPWASLHDPVCVRRCCCRCSCNSE